MKFKEMTVWSGGSKNAKTAKLNTLGCLVCFFLLCILHIVFFVANFHDDKTIPMTFFEHIFCGSLFLGLLGWLTLLMFFTTKSSFKNVLQNKLIKLYLYKIEDFVKLGEIPDDKFVVFSDESGVVLADKVYEKESRAFSFEAKHFYDFEKYFDKKAFSTENICIDGS